MSKTFSILTLSMSALLSALGFASQNASESSSASAVDTIQSGDTTQVQNRAGLFSSRTLPPELFTVSHSPDVRPFTVPLVINTVAKVAKDDIINLIMPFLFTSDDEVNAYIRYNGVAGITEVQFTLSLDSAFIGKSVWFYYALQPSADTTPTSLGGLLKLPGARRDLLHPAYPGGLVRNIEGSYKLGSFGVSTLIKGTPNVGSHPRLLLGVAVRNGTGAAVDVGLTVAHATVYFNVHRC